MTTTVYGTKVSEFLTERIAQFMASPPGSSPDIDFTGGMLVVGDGNGTVPTVDAILANGGVLHQVWQGETISAVTVDANNPNQVDIMCVIPSGVGGDEIGPFTVREFAIYVLDVDAALKLAVVGTTTLEKTTSDVNGQTSDLVWIASIAVASSQPIIMTDPSAYFATAIDIRNLVNANRATAEEPIYIDETTTLTGWIHQFHRIRRATMAILGVGRQCTDAEFESKHPAPGGFQFPWVGLEQFWSVIDDITIPTIPGALAPLSRNMGANRYEAAIASADDIRTGTTDVALVTPGGLASAHAFVALADGATIPWDMAAGFNRSVTIAGNRIMSTPTNVRLGIPCCLALKQDATGGRTVSWSPAFDWGAAGAPTLSTAPGKTDIITMVAYSTSPVRLRCTIAKG